ncbi:hypothetical protein EDC94DRAFT_645379 [Helicostylum pulchrum]|nr:hypothetical protein EDC94DRAFT_645379 [Helicostylum pulchrum]
MFTNMAITNSISVFQVVAKNNIKIASLTGTLGTNLIRIYVEILIVDAMSKHHSRQVGIISSNVNFSIDFCSFCINGIVDLSDSKNNIQFTLLGNHFDTTSWIFKHQDDIDNVSLCSDIIFNCKYEGEIIEIGCGEVKNPGFSQALLDEDRMCVLEIMKRHLRLCRAKKEYEVVAFGGLIQERCLSKKKGQEKGEKEQKIFLLKPKVLSDAP